MGELRVRLIYPPYRRCNGTQLGQQGYEPSGEKNRGVISSEQKPVQCLIYDATMEVALWVRYA